MDWNTFDYENDWYELYPDVTPELHWEGHDGTNRKWGLKPSEKTLAYAQVPDDECTMDIKNPVQLEGNVEGRLTKAVEDLRTKLYPLHKWYVANKDDRVHVKVHTGTIVGTADLGIASEWQTSESQTESQITGIA